MSISCSLSDLRSLTELLRGLEDLYLWRSNLCDTIQWHLGNFQHKKKLTLSTSRQGIYWYIRTCFWPHLWALPFLLETGNFISAQVVVTKAATVCCLPYKPARHRQQKIVVAVHMYVIVHIRAARFPFYGRPRLKSYPCMRNKAVWSFLTVHMLSVFLRKLQYYIKTSCPARRCSGIRAPRWTRSLRSTCSAQLCRFAITQPRDEQTPLLRKNAHRWACIIAAFTLEKEAF